MEPRLKALYKSPVYLHTVGVYSGLKARSSTLKMDPLV